MKEVDSRDFNQLQQLGDQQREWQSFIGTIMPELQYRLGDESFPVVCRLLEYERKGIIHKSTLKNLFVEMLADAYEV